MFKNYIQFMSTRADFYGQPHFWQYTQVETILHHQNLAPNGLQAGHRSSLTGTPSQCLEVAEGQPCVQHLPVSYTKPSKTHCFNSSFAKDLRKKNVKRHSNLRLRSISEQFWTMFGTSFLSAKHQGLDLIDDPGGPAGRPTIEAEAEVPKRGHKGQEAWQRKAQSKNGNNQGACTLTCHEELQ